MKTSNGIRDEFSLKDLWDKTPSRITFSTFKAKRRVDNILFHQERQRIRLLVPALSGIAAVIAGIIIGLSLQPDSADITELTSVSTLSGPNRSITLPDGTNVILNAKSQLVYPEEFSGDCRQVFLSGEALFDVTHDKDRPFIVNVSDYRIEVLGTVFNVSDYLDDNISHVYLKEGRIRLVFEDHESMLLDRNQGIVYDKSSGEIKKTQGTGDSCMDWSRDMISFHGADIFEIIKTAERRFNVDISCADHPKYTSARITATFDSCDDIRALLNVLKRLIPEMEYTIEDSHIYLK